MTDNKIHFKVITHEKVVFDDYVNEIYSRSIDGDFGVLYNHIPFMTALDIGVTKIVKDGEDDYIATIGGTFQINDNLAVILTDEAQLGADIDIVRAKNAQERALMRLNQATPDTDIVRAEIALAKAMARLKASAKYH